MSEFSRPYNIPDALRPPEYFRNEETLRAHRLIDQLLAPAHTRVGTLTEHESITRRVNSDSTVSVELLDRADDHDGTGPYFLRCNFESKMDESQAPYIHLVYRVRHETARVVRKAEMSQAALQHITKAFEAQYDRGVLSLDDVMTMNQMDKVALTEAHAYDLQYHLPVVRSFKAGVKVRLADKDINDMAAYRGADLMETDGHAMFHDANNRSLGFWNEDAQEGFLTNSEHEDRVIKVLLRLGLVTLQEVHAYRAMMR